MKSFLAAAAAALLIAVPVASFAADTPQAPVAEQEAQGPDFSACDAMEGRDYGQCVAEIAMAYGDDHAQNADETSDAKDAHQAAGQSDEHVSASQADENEVAEAAQAMVEKCDAKEGPAFGECVSALAQQLGALAGGHDGAPHGDAATSTAMVRGQSGR
jgi:hypothetical protein